MKTRNFLTKLTLAIAMIAIVYSATDTAPVLYKTGFFPDYVYSIQLVSGNKLDGTTLTWTVADGTNVDFNIYLYKKGDDLSGTSIATGVISGTTATLTFRATTKGTYYIKVAQTNNIFFKLVEFTLTVKKNGATANTYSDQISGDSIDTTYKTFTAGSSGRYNFNLTVPYKSVA